MNETMRLTMTLLLIEVAATGCGQDPSSRQPTGLPAATDWGPAHVGSDVDPHGGVDVDTDPAMAALQPPDPSRPIDRSKFLRGNIVAADEVAGAVQPGAIVFLSVRPIDPTSGDIIGSPLAVARLEVTSLPMAFTLDERNAMSAGTAFDGEVVIVARVDRDGEARSKTSGDVEGTLRARIPADKLTVRLSELIP